MKVAFYTLGCKVNQYDTQMMRDRMEAIGFKTVPFEEEADVYVVNTCTVTQISDKKSRQMISRAKRKYPKSILVVCGCFSQVFPKEAALLEGVDIVLGTANRKNISRYIKQFMDDKKQVIAVDNTEPIDDEEIKGFGEKNRAIIKIEDGCENFCSYCLIPYARGRIRSKPIDVIREEVKRLVTRGYKEFVLTGIHLASYGKDFGNKCLEEAIITVATLPAVQRVRLGSLEPRIITPDFVDAIKDLPTLCHHFHLSLQSGCDKTLKAMNRHYTADEYKKAVKLLRSVFPDCSVTTDMIVGFPGETDEDFKESLTFAKKIGFAKIHIFPYSARKGTRAAQMEDQLTKEIKTARAKRLERVEKASRLAYWKNMIGTVQRVLPEELKDGYMHGFSQNYCPVRWEGKPSSYVQTIQITDVDENGLIGKKVTVTVKRELKNIQKLRKLYKKTQSEMADIIDYPLPLYRGFEDGRYLLPEVKLRELCEYFNVSREYLCKGIENKQLNDPLCPNDDSK